MSAACTLGTTIIFLSNHNFANDVDRAINDTADRGHGVQTPFLGNAIKHDLDHWPPKLGHS